MGRGSSWIFPKNRYNFGRNRAHRERLSAHGYTVPLEAQAARDRVRRFSRAYRFPSDHHDQRFGTIPDRSLTQRAVRKLYVPLRIAVIPGHALHRLAQHLLQATAKRDAAHGVQQKVDAEVGVVKQHEELLQAPEQRRRLPPRQGEEEHAQANHVAETERLNVTRLGTRETRISSSYVITQPSLSRCRVVDAIRVRFAWSLPSVRRRVYGICFSIARE